ncbi:MAG TPA: hypothetical protein VIX73_32760, partial [Kofleriaceae bacterium]
MLRVLACTVAAAAACSPPPAPVPVRAPRALSFSIAMQDHRAGDIELRIAADGARSADLRFSVRGAVETIHS